jgi:hypothetical protein
VARPILGMRRFVVLILAAFAAATASGQRSSAVESVAECRLDGLAAVPQARQGEVREFERQVKLGPFYKELTRRFGTPEACKTTFDDGNINLSFTYRGDARLNAKMDSRIEFTEQRVQLSGLSAKTWSAKTGIALLKLAETNAFGTHGCGIEWKTPAETIAGERAGSREAVYQGDTCNCQARVIYEGGAVVGLVLSSAC